MNSADSLSALFQSLEQLHEEVRVVTRRARATLEAQWTRDLPRLGPVFAQWFARAGHKSVFVYEVSGGAFRECAALRQGNTDAVPTSSQAANVDDVFRCFPESWRESLPSLVRLALASREVQVDFGHGLGCLPIVFFDNPAGLVVFERPGLAPADFAAFVSEAGAWLDVLRNTVVGNVRERRLLGLERAS